jgi:AraC family transcriptional regulator
MSCVHLLYRIQIERRYGEYSFPPHKRKAWAFQIILDGTCSLLIRKGDRVLEEHIKGPILCVAGPDCVHVWSGKPEDRCNVMVFHFDQADPILCSVLGQDGYRYIRLSKADIPLLQSLYNRCNQVRRTPGFTTKRVRESYKKNAVNLSNATVPPRIALDAGQKAAFYAPLIYDIVSKELTLLFLKYIPRADLGNTPDFGDSKVAEALAWYGVNLPNGPSIQEVAAAIHVSPTHLRRLFHKVRGMSPQAAFTHLQFERSKLLMKDRSMSFERVAENSGFGSASAFSRTFKKEFGISPKQYRMKLNQTTHPS